MEREDEERGCHPSNKPRTVRTCRWWEETRKSEKLSKPSPQKAPLQSAKMKRWRAQPRNPSDRSFSPMGVRKPRKLRDFTAQWPCRRMLATTAASTSSQGISERETDTGKGRRYSFTSPRRFEPAKITQEGHCPITAPSQEQKCRLKREREREREREKERKRERGHANARLIEKVLDCIHSLSRLRSCLRKDLRLLCERTTSASS